MLDGATLKNLEVFETDDALNGMTSEGSLFSLLDHCVTPFGRREFKRWVCFPLRSVRDIEARLDAVDELMIHRDGIALG